MVENGFLAVENEWLFLGEEADSIHFQNNNIEIKKAQFLPALSQWLFKVKVTGDKVRCRLFATVYRKSFRLKLGEIIFTCHKMTLQRLEIGRTLSNSQINHHKNLKFAPPRYALE